MMEKKMKIVLMVNHKGHVSVRTCVSCRIKMDKKELIRFVLEKDDLVVIDEFQQKKAGAYIFVITYPAWRGLLRVTGRVSGD